MPKIQYSALVTNMKGKSNGSVFSNNSGGAYFRNNPNGGGKKSPKWDAQKNKMISIAQSWKNLDESIQDAWNSAVNDFPTTNAFGATRIPSGYELYVRLNTTQLTFGNELLTSPPSPRSAPVFGSLNVEYPDYFQLNPQNYLSLFNNLNGNNTTYLTNETLYNDVPITRNSSYSFRFEFSRKWNSFVSSLNDVVLMSVVSSGTQGIMLSILGLNSDEPKITFIYNSGENSAKVEAKISRDLLNSPFHISIVTSDLDLEMFYIYVNGIDMTSDRSKFGVLPTGNITGTLYIGSGGVPQSAFLSVSDIRFFDLGINEEQANLIYNGYTLDNELAIFDCTSQYNGVLTQWGGGETPITLNINDYNPKTRYIQPCSFSLVPLFSIEIENEGASKFDVIIYATPPVSNGRTGKMSNYKLVGSFAWQSKTSFDVHDQLRELFGNIPANCQIGFYCQVYDKLTGVVSPVKSLVTRKRPRFKAGSDLSTRVK